MLGDGEVVDQGRGRGRDAHFACRVDRHAAVIQPEMLHKPQAPRSLHGGCRQALLVQDEKVGVLHRCRDLLERAGETEAPFVVGVKLTEGGDKERRRC